MLHGDFRIPANGKALSPPVNRRPLEGGGGDRNLGNLCGGLEAGSGHGRIPLGLGGEMRPRFPYKGPPGGKTGTAKSEKNPPNRGERRLHTGIEAPQAGKRGTCNRHGSPDSSCPGFTMQKRPPLKNPRGGIPPSREQRPLRGDPGDACDKKIRPTGGTSIGNRGHLSGWRGDSAYASGTGIRASGTPSTGIKAIQRPGGGTSKWPDPGQQRGPLHARTKAPLGAQGGTPGLRFQRDGL